MSPVKPTVLDRFHTGELGFMVTSVRNSIHEALERELAPFELTTPQYVVLNCLAKGTNCGTFKPSTTWPGIGGVMTWSTNWDASNGNQFANNEGVFVHAMP